MAKDTETKLRFVELRAQGLSYDRIAKELQASKPTLIGWARVFELEIQNLRVIELESLLEQYCMTKAKRIELLGKKLKTIKNELESRDLKDVPTDKLIILFLKCFELAKQEAEAVEPTFAEREPLDTFEMRTLREGILTTWTF